MMVGELFYEEYLPRLTSEQRIVVMKEWDEQTPQEDYC